MTTAILTDSRYAAHTNPIHVERKERLDAIEKALDSSGLRENILTLAARSATDDELSVVHFSPHLESLKRKSEEGGGELDPDTYMTPQSWEAAIWAAGGAIRLVEAVVKGECHNGFALLRPPGHHATSKRAMGFCLINNIAVAARYANQNLGVERIAIVDYDVHHGNGTQDIFYDDPKVLYCSTHASPFYPGTGSIEEMGKGDGQGATLNMPLPPGVGDKGYERMFDQVLIPALRSWKPDLILVSAGYDAHWSDPIGPMVLSVTGYERLTAMLYDLANELCQGRIVLMLEGGYNLDALGACTVAALQVLTGTHMEKDPLGVITAPEPDISNVITALLNRHPLLAS
jgi:acetoin utilization deacetylase AcuC-like enzyme